MSQENVANTLRHIDEIIIRTMNTHPTVGLCIGIIHNGHLLYDRSIGLAHTKKKRSVTTNTVFRIGAISKTFTAVALMQLWEQGKFHLDDPINDYLKSYKIKHPYVSAPPITFRHMLTHTSGIGELRSILDLPRSGHGLFAKPGQPIPTPPELYQDGLSPEIYPQMKFVFSQHTFNTLGQLIEDMSGESFTAYMKKNIFEPLRMTYTDYQLNHEMQDHFAQGYRYKQGKMEPVVQYAVIAKGAEGVFSSIDNMSRYLIALSTVEEKDGCSPILKAETIRLMMEPNYQLDRRLPAMGLGFGLEMIHGHRVIVQEGRLSGFSSCLCLSPDDKIGIIVLANSTSFAPTIMAKDIFRTMLNLPHPVSELPYTDVLETPHLWSDICGFYGIDKGIHTNIEMWKMLGGEVEIYVKDHHLAIRSPLGPLRKGIRLYPIDASDPFIFRTSPQEHILWPSGFSLPYLDIVFKSNVTGHIDRLCAGLNVLYKRPWTRSLHVRILVGSGILAGLAAVGIGLARRK